MAESHFSWTDWCDANLEWKVAAFRIPALKMQAYVSANYIIFFVVFFFFSLLESSILWKIQKEIQRNYLQYVSDFLY